MAISIAKFPFVRTLDGFEFDAQPSLDPKQIRELATCRWVANGDALAAARAARRGQDASGGGARPRSDPCAATRRCSPRPPALVTASGQGAHAEGRLEERLGCTTPSPSC